MVRIVDSCLWIGDMPLGFFLYVCIGKPCICNDLCPRAMWAGVAMGTNKCNDHYQISFKLHSACNYLLSDNLFEKKKTSCKVSMQWSCTSKYIARWSGGNYSAQNINVHARYSIFRLILNRGQCNMTHTAHSNDVAMGNKNHAQYLRYWLVWLLRLGNHMLLHCTEIQCTCIQ